MVLRADKCACRADLLQVLQVEVVEISIVTVEHVLHVCYSHVCVRVSVCVCGVVSRIGEALACFQKAMDSMRTCDQDHDDSCQVSSQVVCV